MKEQLAKQFTGVATVLFHSVVLFSLPQTSRDRVETVISQAAKKASHQAPLAWLSMERGESRAFEIRLTLWPGGQKMLVARTDPLGQQGEIVDHFSVKSE